MNAAGPAAESGQQETVKGVARQVRRAHRKPEVNWRLALLVLAVVSALLVLGRVVQLPP